MDIFTTQLTRVVPVPIKPASLKVKALLKEAANSKLSQDPDHLENHEYYFTSEEDQYHPNDQEAEQENKSADTSKESQVEALGESLPDSDYIENKEENTKNDKLKHLDLFV